MDVVSSRDQVRGFISDTFFVDKFSDEDSFLRNGIIDSTGMMELVAFLEQQFSIKIADTELIPENLDSVVNVCRFVQKKQAGN
jgi:acyl carrier protein